MKILLLILISSLSYASTEDLIVTVTDYSGGGTGFFLEIGNKTYIITNDHVCGKGSSKSITEYSGKQYSGKVLFKSKEFDLCAIQASGKGFHLANKNSQCGEYLLTGGHPGLEPLKFFTAQHCDRVFLNKVIGGQSGSPILNLDLEVIGVMDATFTSGTNAGYFIPLYQLKKFLEGK